ncbi:MAG TPA: DinB family protein [Flavobacteriaceae bacterium]|nr:DinB family protein [Flavobacteriaceae bacterium]
MTLSKQLAGQFREVLLNGTWVATNYKTQLSNVNWEQATTKKENLNTLASLAFHIDYYIAGLIQVFQGGSLDIKDKYSYDAPPITSKHDWERRLQKLFDDAKTFGNLVEQMSEAELMAPFVEDKYGSNYRNILALIEHCYYHLGQIVLIKKLLDANSKSLPAFP